MRIFITTPRNQKNLNSKKYHKFKIHITKMAKISYAAAIKNAIVALKERGGSSLAAIKAYIAAHHADNNANVSRLI